MIEERGWPYVRIMGWDINIYIVVILMIIGFFIGVKMKTPYAPYVGVAIGGCAAAILSPQLTEPV